MSNVLDVVRLPRLGAIVRYALPNIVEGVVLPVAVFYTTLAIAGLWGALIAALTWSYLSLARRALSGRRVSGMLALTALTLTVRFSITFATGSVAVYFLQPVIGQILVAVGLLLSLRSGEPVLLRLAGDVVPPETLADRPCVGEYFRQITVFWALVLVAHALAGLWLLESMQIETYVVTKTVLDGVVKSAAIGLSIWWFKRLLRTRGISVAFG